jgi:transcriptional regulator with XRE-family HTH domain
MTIRSTSAILPPPVRRSLTKLGSDIRLARRRRRLTIAMMAERLAISVPTYLKIERGNPGVSIGAYAMALSTLGLGAPFSDLADPARDVHGTLLETERLPQRVRPRKDPGAL